jgi:hypothetical protein
LGVRSRCWQKVMDHFNAISLKTSREQSSKAP